MPTIRINKENENAFHFLTLTTIEWVNIFTKPEYFKIIVESLDYCRKKKGLMLFEYVIMTNHIHLIACAKEGHKLSQIISDFKKHTTRAILEALNIDNRKYTPTVSSQNSNVNPKNPISLSSVYAVSRISCEGVTLKFWEDTYIL